MLIINNMSTRTRNGYNEREYIYALCAVLYAVAIGIGTSCVVNWLAPPHARSSTSLSAVAASLRTGDLLLWASLFKVRTDVEKVLCGSQYTHVSIVFVDRVGKPYVWESLVSGHRVRPLAEVLYAWRHTDLCFLRKINKPLSGRDMELFIRDNLGARYSFDMWRAVFNRWCASLQLPELQRQRGAGNRSRSRFCSQLVGDTLAHLGALDFNGSSTFPRSSLLLPGDFSSRRDRALPWRNSIAYGPEVHLTL